MRMALLPVCLAAALLWAGCGSPRDHDAANGRDVPGGEAASPACGGPVVSVPHLPGGAPVDAPPLHLRPCLAHSGLNGTLEPTVGVLSDGTILFAPVRPGAAGSVCTDFRCGTFGLARSGDQGSSWEDAYPRLVGDVSLHNVNQDPFLYVDPLTDRAFLSAYQGGAAISWTEDAGQTWQHTYGGIGETDHQQIFAGPPRTSALGSYPTIVYYCAFSLGATAAATFGFACSKSLDGGRTFLPGPPVPYSIDPGADGHSHTPGHCTGSLDHGIADSQGILYIPRAECDRPSLLISRDEGSTWTSVVVADKGVSRLYSGEFGTWSSVAVDKAGTIYYAWTADDRLLWLVHSIDQGRTWSTPIQVAAPGVVEVGLPQIVAGGTGQVALSYLGSSDAPGFAPCADSLACSLVAASDPSLEGVSPPGYEHVTWDLYMAFLPHAREPTPTIHSLRINPAGDPLVRGPCGPGRCVGEDFVDAKIGPDGVPYAVFVDHCTGDCVSGTVNSSRDEGVVAWILGGPSLWGPSDPNGPYPDP
jgi:hypothetical protein